MKQYCAAKQLLFCKTDLCVQNGLLLNIKSEHLSSFSDKPCEKCCIMPISYCCIHRITSVRYCHLQKCTCKRQNALKLHRFITFSANFPCQLSRRTNSASIVLSTSHFRRLHIGPIIRSAGPSPVI